MPVTDDKEPRPRFFNSRDTGPRFACARCGEGGYISWQLIRTRLAVEGPICSTCCQRAWKLSKRREPQAIPCASCGESFTPKRSDAKFCSDRCRQRMHRGRGDTTG